MSIRYRLYYTTNPSALGYECNDEDREAAVRAMMGKPALVSTARRVMEYIDSLPQYLGDSYYLTEVVRCRDGQSVSTHELREIVATEEMRRMGL